MTITENVPCTRQFQLWQERSDSDYGSCIWAVITFDLDRYSISIESDCGNFAYTWKSTPNSESFLRLMCRIDKEYFLGKISSRSKFNLEQSKADTIENLELNDYMISEDAKERINNIDIGSEDIFFLECDDILRGEEVRDTFELIEVVKEYPKQAITIAEIFCEKLQPYLREIVRTEATHS